MTTRQWVRAALPVLLLTLAGCVGPAPTTEDYLGKARHSADAAASALSTAQLAVETNSGWPPVRVDICRHLSLRRAEP
jgi:hypothetical protein